MICINYLSFWMTLFLLKRDGLRGGEKKLVVMVKISKVHFNVCSISILGWKT